MLTVPPRPAPTLPTAWWMAPLPAGPELAPQLQEAIAHCRLLTHRHSRTFYLGSRFFPLAQRQAVWAVYTACRNGDDLADEPGGGPAALSEWWARVQAALAGQLPLSRERPRPTCP